MSKKPLNTDDVVSEFQSESAFFQPTSPQGDKATSTQKDKTTKPQIDKYTTHLKPATIKAIKQYALDHDMKDYDVVEAALQAFLTENM